MNLLLLAALVAALCVVKDQTFWSHFSVIYCFILINLVPKDFYYCKEEAYWRGGKKSV